MRRSAISGMIVTIILIGIVVSIGGILATTTTDLVQTGLVLDNVEIKRLAIQNTGTESYITGMVKNAGNTGLTDVIVIVTLDGTAYDAADTTGTAETIDDADDMFVVEFSSRLNSGVSATVNQKMHVSTTDNVASTLAESATPAGSSTAGPIRLPRPAGGVGGFNRPAALRAWQMKCATVAGFGRSSRPPPGTTTAAARALQRNLAKWQNLMTVAVIGGFDTACVQRLTAINTPFFFIRLGQWRAVAGRHAHKARKKKIK